MRYLHEVTAWLKRNIGYRLGIMTFFITLCSGSLLQARFLDSLSLFSIPSGISGLRQLSKLRALLAELSPQMLFLVAIIVTFLIIILIISIIGLVYTLITVSRKRRCRTVLLIIHIVQLELACGKNCADSALTVTLGEVLTHSFFRKKFKKTYYEIIHQSIKTLREGVRSAEDQHTILKHMSDLVYMLIHTT